MWHVEMSLTVLFPACGNGDADKKVSLNGKGDDLRDIKERGKK